jgi:hypothetical protein
MRERHARKRLLTMAALAAVLIAAGAAAPAYGLTGHDWRYSRPSGIPASIPDSQVNLMGLSPVPTRPAPGFTLTDQDGRVLPLSADQITAWDGASRRSRHSSRADQPRHDTRPHPDSAQSIHGPAVPGGDQMGPT